MKKLQLPLFAIMASLALIFSVNLSYAQAPTENSLLWKVTGKNSSTPAYLYGTFHMLCPEDAVFPDSLKSIVKSCASVYLELDMDDPNLGQEVQAGMMIKDGKTWKDFTDAATYAKIDSAMKSIAGIPADAVAGMKPMAVMAFLYPPILGCNVVSPESQFAQIATENKKPINGLEPVKAQIAVFDALPIDQQLGLLKELVLEKDKMKSETERLLKAYLAANLKDIYKLILETEMEVEGMEKILLTDRNKSWIPVIESNLSKESTFYAVGAGHLAGENGVIALLRKAGYTVTPVYLQK